MAARVFWIIAYLEQESAYRRRESNSLCHSFFPRRRGASASREVRSSVHHGQASPSYWYRSGNHLQVGAIASLFMLLQGHPTRLSSQHCQLQCASFQNICTIFWQLGALLAQQALTLGCVCSCVGVWMNDRVEIIGMSLLSAQVLPVNFGNSQVIQRQLASFATRPATNRLLCLCSQRHGQPHHALIRCLHRHRAADR